jgi:hypothetical protein
VALGVVVGLLACRSKTPALVLEFSGLPAEATDLTVDIFNDHWEFTGADVAGGPVTITRPDGRLHLGIDRGYLSTKHDRLRLPLETTETLDLESLAAARVGTRWLSGETRGTAVPGQDLTLAIALSGERQVDAGASDAGSTEAPPTLGPDDAALPIADAAADRPDTALPPDSVAPDGPPAPVSCATGATRPIGMMVASGEPALAYVAPLFTAVWTDGSRVLFNAVDRDGKLQHPADVVAVPADSAAIYRNPRLALAGSSLFLAYGKSQGGGGAGVVVRALQPATGAAGISLLLNGPTTDGSAPEIGGLVAGGNLAVVSRAHATGAAQARVDLISTALAPLKAQSHAALAGAFVTGIGWSAGADRYGVAAIDGSPAGATLATFDVDLGFDRPLAFTADGALPMHAVGGATVSVAGAGDRLAVAWIDGLPCPACKSSREVYLATVEVRTGVASRPIHVSASDSTMPKLFPHVVWDGASYAVAWEEYASPQMSRVMLRRFDPALRPLGEIVDASATAPARPSGDIALVVEDRNRYGVAMTPHLDAHHFTRITCTGP